MLTLPKAAEPLLSRFSIAFTRPTFQRVIVLFVGFVLTLGRRTVTRTLWTARSLCSGHFSDYHRLFSRARWSLWPLGKALAAAVLELVPPDQPVLCPVDDSAMQHRGKKVYGKGRHRDGCRSTRTHNVWIWGHCWVVLAVNVNNYLVDVGVGVARFDGQVVIETAEAPQPFGRPGDSGSLIVDEEGRPVGLLFAGSASGGAGNVGITGANPISSVAAQLGVTLI